MRKVFSLACGFGLSATTLQAASQESASPAAARATTATALEGASAVDPNAIAVTGSTMGSTLRITSWAQALDLLRARNVTMRTAAEETTRAAGLSRQALGVLLPQLDASASAEHHLIRETVTLGGASRTLPTSPTAMGSLTLALPILAPEAWSALGSAWLSEDIAKLGQDDAFRLAVLSLASSMVTLVTAEHMLELRTMQTKSAEERTRLTERKSAGGSAARIDVVRAEQDLAQTRSARIVAEESVHTARDAVGLVLGVAGGATIASELVIDDLTAALSQSCKPASPEQRADVVRAQKQVELAKREAARARRESLPNARVQSSFTVASEDFSNAKPYVWSVMGVVGWSLYDGGSRYGRAAAGEASARANAAQAEQSMQAATVEVQSATRAMRYAQARRDESSRAHTLAVELETLTRKAFEAGAATSFDLIETGRRAREAEVERVVADFELARARVSGLIAKSACSVR